MIADYESQLYATLWTLLEASSDFTAKVKFGNRIRYDGTNVMPEKNNKMDGDLPEVTIDHAGANYPAFSADPSYSYSDSTDLSDVAWIEVDEVSYLLIIVMPDVRMAPSNQLTAIVRQALRKGGPQLGQTFVKSWRLQRDPDRLATEDKDGGGAKRRVVILRLSVQMDFTGGDLAAQA